MKILIADNQALFRDGLSFRLKEIIPDADIRQFSGFQPILKNLNQDKDIDLIILDVEMQDMNWQEALKEIRENVPKAKIAVLSATEDNRTIKLILNAGADGYIPKTAEIKTFSNALQLILNGETYIPPVTSDIVPINNLSGKSGGIKILTHRQAQVLDLIAQGKSNKQIAYDIGVSESTVKLHINALLRSLHVSNRTQAVITAQKMGII